MEILEQNLNKILDKICAKQCYYTTIYNLGHFTGILTDKNLNNIVDSVCEATKYGDVPELDFLSTQFKTKLTYEPLDKIVNTSIERKIDEKSLFENKYIDRATVLEMQPENAFFAQPYFGLNK